ncbi:hypothetical protein [Brevibacterium sp. ZH18]|uniref:hypothetical protein n=1 Tax=Brevibacterium sp. ZH18 TaxID=2927784 RepID=UPI001F6039E0|nr:hypothetical protein [Brevibacterium sp. ZH18]MCI4011594.1 hypothetical protein [Brevibacterium sp. ZH18]
MMKSRFVADGVIKMLIAVAVCATVPALEAFFLAPRWLVIGVAVMLFLSSATEISYGVSRGEKRFLKYPMAFDGLWVLVTIAAIILAIANNPAAGYVWFGYVGLGSLAIAIVFTTGANGPDFGDEQ